jgi:hypothetical protein
MLGAFINGVGLSNHMLAALATPVYVVLVLIWWHRKRVFGWHVLACLGLWFLGASPYLVVVVRAIAITGEPARIIRSATTGGWPAANLSISTSLLAKSAAWILIQYPTLLVIAGIFGIWVKPPQSSLRLVKGAVVAVTVVQLLFAVRYPVDDQYEFFLPFYAVITLLIGLGMWKVIDQFRWARWVGLVLALSPVGFNAAFPSIMRRLQPDLFAGVIAYQDHYRTYCWPWRNGDYALRRFTDKVLDSVPKDALLFYDYITGTAIVYAQGAEGRRPDLLLVPAWRPIELGWLVQAAPSGAGLTWCRPVYALAPRPPYIPAALSKCQFIEEGPVWRAELPEGARLRRSPRSSEPVPAIPELLRPKPKGLSERPICPGKRWQARIIQARLQQRFTQIYQEAIELIHGGRLGHIITATAWIGPDGVGGRQAPQDPPVDLDWDLWLGPALQPHGTCDRHGRSPSALTTARRSGSMARRCTRG